MQFPDGVRVTKTGLAKNEMHVVEYPADGTEVQFIGCSRASEETTCVVGGVGADKCLTTASAGATTLASPTTKKGGTVPSREDDETNESSLSSSSTSVDSEESGADSSTKSLGLRVRVVARAITLLLLASTAQLLSGY